MACAAQREEVADAEVARLDSDMMAPEWFDFVYALVLSAFVFASVVAVKMCLNGEASIA
jgi:hypothetical protein